MKILVFGAGAIGSVFGGFLSRTKNEITLLGRPWHIEKIRKDGLLITGIWGRHRFKRFNLWTTLKKEPFDIILITVKSYDTLNVARQLKTVSHPETIYVSLQNGIGNLEILKHHVPKQNLVGGRVIFGAEIKPGRVKVTVSADKVVVDNRKIADLFNSCGIATRVVSDINPYIWAKAVYNCALNPLATVLGVHYGALLEIEETRFIMDRIIEEFYQVAKLEGVKMVPSTAKEYKRLFFKELVPLTYNHHPSMLQDINRSRPTEIEFLNGRIVELAKRHNIDVPYNKLITELIRAKESLQISL